MRRLSRIGSRVHHGVAKRPGPLLIVAGLVLLPWLVWLVATLPQHYSAHHYWLSWAGFDVALAASLIVTGRRLMTGDPGWSERRPWRRRC